LLAGTNPTSFTLEFPNTPTPFTTPGGTFNPTVNDITGPARGGLIEYGHEVACLSWESRGVARQLRHTSAEMEYRRYHRFIPNVRGREEANAAKGLAST
jgi:hypothetical protein